MTHPELVLLVRFKSPLSLDEVTAVAKRRLGEYRELAGLKQKYYLHDAASGEYAGLYLWESAEALDAFRKSELRASIASAYRVDGEPRIEVFNVFLGLREEAA